MGGNRFQSGEHIVGKSVQKKFRGYGVFTGKVVSYNSARGFYKIRYEDGDAEEVDVDDVRGILVLEDENGRKRKRDDETPKRRKKRQKNGVGRPRKTPNGEQTPNGGKTPNGGEVRKRGRPRKNRGQEPEVWNTEILEGSRGKEAEVSNTGPLGRSGGKEGEVSNTGPLGRSGGKEGEVSNTGPLEGCGGKEAEVSNTEPLEGSGGKEAEVSNTVDLGRSGGKEAEVLNSGDLARSTGKEVEVSNAEPPNRKRFRRKKLDVWNAGPVRRSPRVKESAENAIEKPTQHKRRSRRVNVQNEGLGGSMPSVPQLPPSSSDLGVPEESVPNLLYVYNSLRSFSRLLFLSPFGLDDFVGALNCKSANSLLDAVHVKLLQALRRHLYSVSREEGSAAAAAAKCLRHQDWNFLDMITWPVYLVEYLTAQGFSKMYGQKVSRLRLLDDEYYRTPVPKKLTILQFLCDDVMEAEEIRAEISMRLNDESDAETDINVNLSPGVRSVKNLRPGRVCRRLWKENEEDDHGSSISNQMLVENVNYVGDKTTLQRKLRQSQATKDEKRRSVENLNSDECCLCGMDGTLICCDSCPAAYHSRCVGVSKAFLPEGDWYCPECLVKKRTKGLEALSGLQGAELLGYDPYGRVYFSACGYLLVSDSSFDRAITHKYYNKNDTVKVLKILDSSDPLYKNIRNAFVNSRNIPIRYRDEPKHKMSTKADNFSDKCSSELSAISVSQSFVQQDRKKGYVTTSLGTPEDVNLKKVASQKLEGIHHCDVAGRKEDDEVFVMDQICDNTQLASSEGSLEITSLNDVQEHQKSSVRHFNDSGAHRCLGFTKHSALQEELVTETDVGSAAVQVEQVKQSDMGTNSVVVQKRFNSNPSNKEVTFHPNAYINQYVLGDMAASAAANLAVKGAQFRRVNLQVSSKKSPSSALAEQVKIFSREAVHFCWPCFSKKVMEVPKEGCGWCFVCKSSPGSRSRCLLNIAAGNIMTGAARMAGGLRPTKNGDGHFPAIVAYILYMEDQLHGLLEGPWENPSYRKHWRKSIEQASTVAEVKYYLLKLEMNIRPVALAAAWTKPVDDSSTMVSSNRIVTSVAGITPKRGGRFQRGQRHSGATKIISASVDAKMFGVNWWRGGRFSDQALHWKVLPCSTARRAGRQGGFRRIPGIYYNEGLEIPRRSRQCAWRAAVEMTRSVSQLAVQIRNLDACIRWEDLLNSENFRQLKMVGDKESAVFKKSVICAKNSENGLLKYLIDFGKQKAIPICIVKQGTKVEEALDGTCKYWLSEYHVPLCLLKDFEEEAQLHAHPNKGSKRFRKVHYRLSKTSKLDVFTILLAKAENREKCSCTHCNKDILIRKAVRCHLCQGSFHRKCSISSHISDKLQYMFTCYQCHGVKLQKSKPEIRVQSEKKTGKRRRLSKKLEEIGTSPQDVKLKKPRRHWLHDDNVAIQKHESVGKVRGRRRKTKGDVQKNESVGKVRGRRRKTKGDVVLDGFLWKKNATDELGKDFRKNMLLLPGQNSMNASVCPKCFLCGQAYNPQFLYVACEYCKDWFHGDAFGLTLENITDVIGFKCYKCRKSSAPICPCAKKDNLCDKRLGLMITSDNEVLDEAKNGKPLEVIYNRSKLVSDKELHAKLAREEEHMLAKVEYDPENGPQDLKVENQKPVPEAEKIPNSTCVIVSEQLLTHRIDRESSVHDDLQEEVVNYQQDKRSREETVGFEVHKMESIQIYPGIQPQSRIVPNCSEKLLPVEGGEDAFSQLPNVQNRSENLLPVEEGEDALTQVPNVQNCSENLLPVEGEATFSQPPNVQNCSENLLPVDEGEGAFSQLPNVQNCSENVLPIEEGGNASQLPTVQNCSETLLPVEEGEDAFLQLPNVQNYSETVLLVEEGEDAFSQLPTVQDCSETLLPVEEGEDAFFRLPIVQNCSELPLEEGEDALSQQPTVQDCSETLLPVEEGEDAFSRLPNVQNCSELPLEEGEDVLSQQPNAQNCSETLLPVEEGEDALSPQPNAQNCSETLLPAEEGEDALSPLPDAQNCLETLLPGEEGEDALSPLPDAQNCSETLLPVEEGEDALSPLPDAQNCSETLLPVEEGEDALSPLTDAQNCSETLLPVEEGEDAFSQIQGIKDSVQLCSGDAISPNHSENKSCHLANKFSLENLMNQPYRIGSEIPSEEMEKKICATCNSLEVPPDLLCRACGHAIHCHCYEQAPTGLWTGSGWICGGCQDGFVLG